MCRKNTCREGTRPGAGLCSRKERLKGRGGDCKRTTIFISPCLIFLSYRTQEMCAVCEWFTKKFHFTITMFASYLRFKIWKDLVLKRQVIRMHCCFHLWCSNAVLLHYEGLLSSISELNFWLRYVMLRRLMMSTLDTYRLLQAWWMLLDVLMIWEVPFPVQIYSTYERFVWSDTFLDRTFSFSSALEVACILKTCIICKILN